MHRGIFRRARPIAVSALLAFALVGTLLASGASSDPGDPVAGSPPARDDSTVSAVSAGVSCPDGWRGFSNPVARYALCYPSGWGFTDFTTFGPLPSLLTRSLRNLHLVDASAFPWVAGTRSFDAIASGMIDVELSVLRPGVTIEGECAPSIASTLDIPGLFCEQSYDALGLPAETGPVRALKFEVPLAADGARLLVVVRTASDEEEVNLAWQLVRSIRAF